MDKKAVKTQLKALLLRDVAYLCRRGDRLWSEPIVHMLREIRETGVPAVIFGGTLRSLLLSRLKHRQLGRPRDLDIVVAGTTVDNLRERFRPFITRETRFGGLKLRRMDWQFDVWPLHRTWAFVRDDLADRPFAKLPATTFFNLEAIAVDVWAAPGRTRVIYSGDDQFFEGILSRTLEINREENPFPVLCVVRALLMAASTGFAIGPRLAHYLAANGEQITRTELEETQRQHYGRVYQSSETMRRWLDHVRRSYETDERAPIELPVTKQLTLWPEEEAKWTNMILHVLEYSL